jgi:hypothetical protein
MENGDRSNYETKSILGHADIVKSKGISWLCHVQCMDDHHIAKHPEEEIFGWKKGARPENAE